MLKVRGCEATRQQQDWWTRRDAAAGACRARLHVLEERVPRKKTDGCVRVGTLLDAWSESE